MPAGHVMAAEAGCIAVLDTRLTPALIDEGLAREVVRRVQTMRREADFQLNDRIAIRYLADDNLAAAIERFAASICSETLCESLEQGEADNGWQCAEYLIGSARLSLGVKQLAPRK